MARSRFAVSGLFLAIFSTALVLVAASLAHGQSPPRLDRLTATPSSDFESMVKGGAQAVEPLSSVICLNMETGHYKLTQAAADGSFECRVFAASGAWILVKGDTSGALLRWLADATRDDPVIDHNFHVLVSMAGTVLRVPSASPTSGLAFAASGITGFLPLWAIEGTIDQAAYNPGDSIAIDATYTLLAVPTSGQTAQLNLEARFVKLTHADGSGTLDQNSYASTFTTPTGLPIERAPGFRSGAAFRAPIPLTMEGNRLSGPVRFELPVPATLPPGYYRPVLALGNVAGVTRSTPTDFPITTFIDSAGRHPIDGALLPVFRVGAAAAPSFHSTLLVNTTSGGSRGVNAVEHRDRFSIASRVATAGDRITVPRIDVRTRAAVRYNLEPFALTVGLGDRGAPINPFTIPFRFPSGALTITIQSPDGRRRTIGPAPFRQPVLRGLSTPQGDIMENGGYINDAVQLSTSDAAFDVTFDLDGRHVITVLGTIEDAWGNVWTTEGTYEIDVARPLVTDTALVPGTPLEIGDAAAMAMQLVPPVAADVEMRFRLAADSDRTHLREQLRRGRSNRFGYVRLEPVQTVEAGEYRIDVSAHADALGTPWSGGRTWGGVVAPVQSDIVAHGRRGIDNQTGERPIWFARRQLGLEVGRSHVPFAFFSGDVMWLEKGESVLPTIGIQDTGGTVAPLLMASSSAAALGEIPLQSSTSTGVDAHIDPAAVDVWAYSYRAVSRPLIRVREEIAEESIPAPYWRFNDRYASQTGTGANGDLPNDFKFQFGAAVVRGSAVSPPRYSIYGSLFILVPASDPGGGTRTFPPFQGNGGGPSGGPLFKLKGRDIEMFFHPTAVRPGSILEIGNVASFAGQIGPTLHAKVEIVVTAPSGARRTITGQANTIGYFVDTRSDFIVDEAGIWRAKVRVWFDGVLPSTSGQVQPPYPTGDVLGSREGEFYFYVVDRRSEPLQLAVMPQFVRPADGPITFTMIPPAGLSGVQMTYTTTMPGFILEEGSTSLLQYTYDAQKLTPNFPNLDLRDVDGLTGVDTITMSFLVSGIDANGVPRHYVRQIVLQGEELQMPEQKPEPLKPRRRVVRR